jgi:hypothetical protein
MPRKKTTTKSSATAAATAPPKGDHVSDLVSIKKVAKTADDRGAALAWCLANTWVGEDIGTIERTDTADWHGWSMWPFAC